MAGAFIDATGAGLKATIEAKLSPRISAFAEARATQAMGQPFRPMASAIVGIKGRFTW